MQDGEEAACVNSKQDGVRKARAMQMAATPKIMLMMFGGIFLIGMSTAIESNVVFAFLPFITSEFSAHSRMSTIQIISNVMSTVLKPFSAKFADVTGRFEALVVALGFYIVGYVCIGSTKSIETYTASQVFYIIGQSASSIIIQLIVADMTSIRNRVLFSIIPSTPYLFSGWVGPAVAQKVLETKGWRFGIYMWTIILPVCSSLLLSCLLYLKVQARRQQKEQMAMAAMTRDLTDANVHVEESKLLEHSRSTSSSSSTGECNTKTSSACMLAVTAEPEGMSYPSEAVPPRPQSVSRVKACSKSAVKAAQKMDILGLLLFGASLILMLVPLTLSQMRLNYYQEPAFICETLVGIIMFAAFILYDTKIAEHPVISMSMLRNKTVLFCCISGFLYFMAFYIFDLYITSYLQVVKYVSISTAGYVTNVFSFCSTGAGVCGGIVIKFSSDCIYRKVLQHRTAQQIGFSADVANHSREEESIRAHANQEATQKARFSLAMFIRAGTSVYFIGLVLFAVFVSSELKIGWMIFAMVVLSLGAGCYTMPLQASVQACVSPDEVGSATALILTGTMLGGSFGSAISGGIWTSLLPYYMKQHLPEALVEKVSENMEYALSFDPSSYERMIINDAYSRCTRTLCWIAVGTGALVLACSWQIKPHKNYFVGTQVTNTQH